MLLCWTHHHCYNMMIKTTKFHLIPMQSGSKLSDNEEHLLCICDCKLLQTLLCVTRTSVVLCDNQFRSGSSNWPLVGGWRVGEGGWGGQQEVETDWDINSQRRPNEMISFDSRNKNINLTFTKNGKTQKQLFFIISFGNRLRWYTIVFFVTLMIKPNFTGIKLGVSTSGCKVGIGRK